MELPDLNELKTLGEAFRKTWPADAILITAVAQLVESKGQEYLLRAAPRILAEWPQARFLLVGGISTSDPVASQSYADRLKQTVIQEGLEENVILTGFRKDSLEIMYASDVIVQSAIRPETFGFALVEAMAVGRPVIASRLGAYQELVLDGTTGILVPPRDPEAIAEACLRLLRDPDLRERMGRAGRDRVEKYFKVERMVREIEVVFLKLVKKD